MKSGTSRRGFLTGLIATPFVAKTLDLVPFVKDYTNRIITVTVESDGSGYEHPVVVEITNMLTKEISDEMDKQILKDLGIG